MKCKLVKDDSGHDYVIPSNKSTEWYEFIDLPEDNPNFCNVPAWAIMIGGELEFENPTENGQPIFFNVLNYIPGQLIHDGLLET